MDGIEKSLKHRLKNITKNVDKINQQISTRKLRRPVHQDKLSPRHVVGRKSKR